MLYIQAALLILAAVSWLRPLMSPALDSSQYRSLASCHPPCSIRINATHVLQTLLSALCEFREAHCLYSDVPTEPCVIASLVKSITVIYNSSKYKGCTCRKSSLASRTSHYCYKCRASLISLVPSLNIPLPLCTCTNTHTHTHTCTHAHAHTYTHTHKHTSTHTWRNLNDTSSFRYCSP